MKKNNMDGIYIEIAKIAQEVFLHTDAKVGTYETKDICKAFENNKMRFCEGFDAEKEYSVEEGSFRCSFLARDVFDLLQRYEKAFKVKKADRTQFVKKDDNEETAVSFELQKQAKTMAKSVSKDEYRKAMQHICIDTESKSIVATDGFIMTVSHIHEMFVSNDAKKQYLIEPKLLKSGKGIVSVSKSGFAENCDEVAKCYEGCDRFPNWKGVCDKVSAPINLQGAFNAMKKYVKAASKAEGKQGANVYIEGHEGDDFLTITLRNNVLKTESSQKVNIPDVLRFEFKTCINSEHIKQVHDAEKMYVYRNFRVVFVCGNSFSMIMPFGDMEGLIQPTYGDKEESTDLLSIVGISESKELTTQSIIDEEVAVDKTETIKEPTNGVASVECENTHEEEVIKNDEVNAEFTSTARVKEKLQPKNVHFKPKVGTLHLLHTARKNAKFASELNVRFCSEIRKVGLSKFQNKRKRKENASIYFHSRMKRKTKDEHS